jgi:hypothetical protein
LTRYYKKSSSIHSDLLKKTKLNIHLISFCTTGNRDISKHFFNGIISEVELSMTRTSKSPKLVMSLYRSAILFVTVGFDAFPSEFLKDITRSAYICTPPYHNNRNSISYSRYI